MRWLRRCGTLIGFGVGLAGVLAGVDTVHELWEQKQAAKIAALDARLNGVLGVATIDLTSGRVFSYHADAVFPTASSIKIAILIQLFRAEKAGQFHFTDQITLRQQDDVGGSSGPLEAMLKQGPQQVSVQRLMEDMIVYSDNTATNQCIQLVGMESVNRLLDEFGLPATRLRRKMMDSAAVARGDENVSTPIEMARLVERIYRGTAADRESCLKMLEIMKRVRANMRPVIPASVEVASKPGDLEGVHCETGVVLLPKRPFAVSVMSTYLDEGANPVGDATRLVFDYFSKLAASNVYGRRM